MKDWEGVFALFDASFAEDDGDEMNTRGPEKG